MFVATEFFPVAPARRGSEGAHCFAAISGRKLCQLGFEHTRDLFTIALTKALVGSRDRRRHRLVALRAATHRRDSLVQASLLDDEGHDAIRRGPNLLHSTQRPKHSVVLQLTHRSEQSFEMIEMAKDRSHRNSSAFGDVPSRGMDVARFEAIEHALRDGLLRALGARMPTIVYDPGLVDEGSDANRRSGYELR